MFWGPVKISEFSDFSKYFFHRALNFDFSEVDLHYQRISSCWWRQKSEYMTLYALLKRTRNTKQEDDNWLEMGWCCWKISNGLKFIWKTHNQDLVSFGQISIVADQFSSDFSRFALASNRPRLRPAYHPRNNWWHIECMMTDRPLQQCKAQEQMPIWYLTEHLSKIHFWRKVKFSWYSKKYQNKSKKSEFFTGPQNIVGAHLLQFRSRLD